MGGTRLRKRRSKLEEFLRLLDGASLQDLLGWIDYMEPALNREAKKIHDPQSSTDYDTVKKNGHYVLAGWRNGHRIFWEDEEWIYEDGISIYAETRSCPKCGGLPIEVDGIRFDACFGRPLPGVGAACCGHGACQAYVHFWDGEIVNVSGPEEAWEVVERRKGLTQ